MDLSHATPSAEQPQRLRMEAGERLSLAGDERVFALTSGHVRTGLQNDAGKQVTLDVLGSGELFGALGTALLHKTQLNTPETVNEAVLLAPCEVLVYSSSGFRAMLDRSPALLESVCVQMDARRRRMEQRLVRCLFKSSTGKIACLVAELAERFGDIGQDAIRIPLRFTHKDLGSFVGVKRETVSLAMADLEYRGLLYTKGGYICVVDADKLVRVS